MFSNFLKNILECSYWFQEKTKSIKSTKKSKKEVTKPPDEKNAKEKYNFLDCQKIDTQKA